MLSYGIYIKYFYIIWWQIRYPRGLLTLYGFDECIIIAWLNELLTFIKENVRTQTVLMEITLK